MPGQSIRNNSDILFIFKQSSREVESMYRDIGAYDMLYSELTETFRKAWSERYNYLCTDMTKNKNDCKYRIFNESKNTYIESICETEAFKKHMTLIHTSILICKIIKKYSLINSYKD